MQKTTRTNRLFNRRLALADKEKDPKYYHAKGGFNRAKALSSTKRSEIAAMGGKKRSEGMTAEERSESARKAAQARWGTKKK